MILFFSLVQSSTTQTDVEFIEETVKEGKMHCDISKIDWIELNKILADTIGQIMRIPGNKKTEIFTYLTLSNVL